MHFSFVVRRRQVAAVVGRQRDTRRAAHQDYHRPARLCGDIEQPPRRTADFAAVDRLVRENKKGQLSLTNPRDACEKFARFT